MLFHTRFLALFATILFSFVSAGAARAKNISVGIGPTASHNKASLSLLLSAFEFGFMDFSSVDYGMYPPEYRNFMDLNNARSIHITYYLLDGYVPISHSGNFGISAGLGLSWDNYVFANDITLARHDGMVMPVPIDPGYKKSKFSTFSLSVPLVLGLSFNKFSLSGGVYGDMIVSQHTKYKKPKHKEKYVNYADMLQGGVTVRIGFCHCSLFVKYALTDLFKPDRGLPKVYPLTIGIGLW